MIICRKLLGFDLHAFALEVGPGQTHERAYALNRRSVWPKNTNWGLIGDAFHKFPTFIARIRRVNSIIFLYKDFMRLPWRLDGSALRCTDARILLNLCSFCSSQHITSGCVDSYAEMHDANPLNLNRLEPAEGRVIAQ